MSAPDTPNARHLALLIEVPGIYTDDIIEGGDLREYLDEHESESDFILNCIGSPGVVRVRVELSGEKDSTIVEVWGSVREATLVEPSRGYRADEPHLTDNQLAEQGDNLMRDENELCCEWCQWREWREVSR